VFPTHLDGVRVDSWVESGTEISPYYDSLLGKLMVYAPTREMAVAKIQQALAGGQGLGPAAAPAASWLLYQTLWTV
jgi:acetyl/propionyl-CoA carboxylase alpha subunit